MAQLQNVPSRSKPHEYDERIQQLGPRIRKMFTAPPPDEFSPEGYVLIVIDESQLELRLGAHFTKDPTLNKVYTEKVSIGGSNYWTGDIHAETAKQMDVPRKLAKNLNFGLCLREDTQVLTPNGYKSIQLLRPDDLVITHKGRIRKVTDTQKLQATELIIIKTSSGKVVAATPDHMMRRYFPAANGQRGGHGWVCCEDLHVGDYLQFHHCGYSGVETAPDAECLLLGWYLSEGGVYRSRIKIAQSPKASPDVSKRMTKALEPLGFSWYDIDGTSPHMSAPKAVWSPILDRFGVDQTQRSGDKRVPEMVFALDVHARLMVLGSLWDGDGCVSHTRNRCQISYVSKSREFLSDVVRLLDSVGINSKVFSYPYQNTGSVQVLGTASKTRFLKIVPTVKASTASYAPKKHFDCDEKIVSIDRKQTDEWVYDITVEDDHSFVANGLVTHNCYGMSPASFARYAKLYIPGTKTYDVRSAEKYVQAFRHTYAGVFSYHEKLRRRWNEGKRSYLMISGRYRHFPSYARVSPGTVYNSKIQGSAADVLKVQLWAMDKWIFPNPEFAGLRPLIQVHDEFIFEAPKRIAQKSAVALKYAMEHPFFVTDVPLLASAKICQDWSAKDDDNIPEVGVSYAKIDGKDRIFQPGDWERYLAIEGKATQKSCVAMLSPRQKAWARSLFPELLPVFGKKHAGISIIPIEEYRKRKEENQ